MAEIVKHKYLFHLLLVRTLIDLRVFLKASDEVRIARRTKFKGPKYVKRVLLPMHHEYVAPTERHAHIVLNTEQLTLDQCCDEVMQRLVREHKV